MLPATLLLILAPSLTLRADQQGLALVSADGPVATVAYQVNAGDQSITSGAAALADGRLNVDLSQPDATLTGQVTQLARGVRVDWIAQAPEGPWGGGLRHTYAKPADSAMSRPVTAWIAPTGAHAYEVPGDTPYPDTECQVRVLRFWEQALVVVSSAYDPDWFYGRNFDRTRTQKFAPPSDATPGTMTLTWLWVPASEAEPLDPVAAQRFAAEAAGRPIALSVVTGRVGNLYQPGETIPLTLRLTNTTDAAASGTVDMSAYDYEGRNLLDERFPVTLAARESADVVRELRSDRQGVIFVKAGVRWDGGRYDTRATVGVLPDRATPQTDAESPFGMAAIIASPERYVDQFDDDTVLQAMARIGVRWIRSGFYRLADVPTEEDREQSRQRIAQLASYGILPHVHFGARMPDDAEAFEKQVAATVQRFGDLGPNLEVGNELNLGGTTGDDYAKRMLRPVAAATRRYAPGTEVFTMGLGGVKKDWLDAFEQAGGMEMVDVLSIHPGCHPRAPEFWEGWRGWVFRSQLSDAMAAAQRAGKKVWITECYDPTPPGRNGLDVRTAADYMVRTYLCSLALGVQVIEWYQFQDGVWFAQRNQPDDTEYSFGIVYPDLTPKPQYVAFGAMTRQLDGAKYVGRIDLGAEDLYGVRFERDGRPIDVLWSYREKHECDVGWWPPEKFKDVSRKPLEPWIARWREPVTVTLPIAGEVTVTDVMGNARRVPSPDRELALSLTGSPQYVTGLGEVKLLPEFWTPIGD